MAIKARLNQWTCDDLVCPGCGGRRIVNFGATTEAAANRELREIELELCPSCDPMHQDRTGVDTSALLADKSKALRLLKG